MKGINFPAIFDDFILAPKLKGSDITQWFKEHENGKGVYTVFNHQFEALYTGSSKDLRRRLGEHRSKDKLKAHLDQILFIGINYVKNGDPTKQERQLIKELEPTLNTYRYESKSY